MEEEELLSKLDSLRKQGRIDEGIRLLIENTGKGKTLDPSDTSKIERIWSAFANPLLLEGQIDNSINAYNEMFSHIKHLQDQENTRYHKGLPLYNMGHGFLRKAFHFFLFSFIEDAISIGAYPADALSTEALKGIFKVDSEFLQSLSDRIIREAPATRDPTTVLSSLGIKVVPVELWMLEYQMQKTEKVLREFIETSLSKASQKWWEDLIPDGVRKEVDDRIVRSSQALWFSEQPTSPLEYLSFPQDYIKILADAKCWPHFEPTFKRKAVLQGRLDGLGHIRHKIAHYRKVSDEEKQMFGRTIQWLKDCLK
jgi:hypothetical protein